MVGREEELEILYGLLGDTLASNGNLVLISGEAGIGKTRILNALIETGRRGGFRVLIGRCIAGMPSPYLPFYEAFSAMPENPLTPHGIEEGQIRGRITPILFNVLNLIIQESKRQPLLLCLEDLQWADKITVQLLSFLARNISGLRVLLVGTYRNEDVLSEDGKEVHPLRAALHELIREGTVTQIDLRRIDEEPLAVAVSQMLDGAVERSLSEKIVKESNGNPLYLVETLRMLASSGSIAPKDGMWCFTNEREMAIPPTIREVILRRLERLPKEYLRLLECASVVGEYFDPKVVEIALGIQRMYTLESLELLETGYQLVRAAGDEYRFDHERIRAVTYDRVSSHRRRELHGLVGSAIETISPEERNYGALAHHFLDAGQSEKCSRYSLLAGEYFLRASGGAEAIPYFLIAVDKIPSDMARKPDRFRALLGLGDAYVDQVDFRSADQAYREAFSLVQGQSLEAKALWRDAACHFPTYLGKGSWVEAKRLLERAEGFPGLDALDLGSIWSLQAELKIYEGDKKAAEALLMKAEQAFAEAGAIVRLSDTLCVHTDLLVSTGRLDEAIVKAEEALALLKKVRNPGAEIQLWLILGERSIMKGDEERAERHFRTAEEIARRSGHTYIVLAHMYLERLLELQGDFDGARYEAHTTLECAERGGWLPYLRATFCSILAEMMIMTGDVNKAVPLVEKAGELISDFDKDARTSNRGRILLARAMLQGARGDMDGCMSISEEAMGHFYGKVRDPFFEALTRQTFGLFLKRMGKAEEANRELIKAIELFTSVGNEKQAGRLEAILK